jgi:uncharacterized protein
VRSTESGPGPLQRACARLFEFLLRRRRPVLFVSAALAVCAAIGASRLTLSTDWVEPFLPESDVELRSYADALRRFGETEALYVDVSAPDADRLHAAADLVETDMRASGLFTRVTGRLGEWDLRRTAEAVGAATASLLDEQALAEVDARTRPEALAARMEEHYERLLGPVGGLSQDMLARDPLELTSLVLERAGGAGAGVAARVERGRVVSADGRHALVVGVAAAKVGDEIGGAAIESFFDMHGTRLADGAGLAWVGGHRHYRANSQALQRDMTRMSIVAVTLVLGVILLGFRGARITWISALAVAVGTVVGGAALALAWPACSGIALGFGAALSGISVDYVVHLHAERRAGERRVDAVRRVFVAVGPSVVIGAATSAAGFLMLCASDVPAHRQLGLAAAAGVLGALAFALFPGPIVAAAGRRDEPAAADDPPNAFDRTARALFGWILRRPGVAFGVGAALVGVCAAALPGLRFESDVRRFEVRDVAVDAAQAAIAGTWGDLFTQQMIVVPGPDVETALRRTDDLVAALRPLAGRGFAGIASTSSAMPSVATQRRRLAAWRAFWTPERRARVRRDLVSAAAEFGIKASTFEPFFASLDAEPAALLPADLAGTPLETVVGSRLSVRQGDVLSLVVLTGAARSADIADDPAADASPEWRRAVAAACPEARVMSGRGLADAVVGATRRQFATLALPALAVVALLLALYYRSFVLAAVGVFPLAGGLVVAGGLMVACGERLNLLNAAVALPVFGLGVDYAVFLMDSMRDAARDAPADRAARIESVGLRMGTMIGDVLTTVAGSIAMIFAATPAIFSIGLAMTAGVVGAMVVAWLMVPQALIWTGRVPR